MFENEGPVSGVEEENAVKIEADRKARHRGTRAPLVPGEEARLRRRFGACFDATDSNHDGNMLNDIHAADEFRAALRLQGLTPSERQLQQWRTDYGEGFTRNEFIAALIAFVTAEPKEFETILWSHFNCGCRLDCIPVGSDTVRMSADTISIHQNKGVCAVNGLSNRFTCNIETCRSRWIHIHVPLLPMVWVSAYVFEGAVLYALVAICTLLLTAGSDISLLDVTYTTLIAPTTTCLVWWSARLLIQLRSRRGHAYVHATGCTLPPESSTLADVGHVEGKFHIGWQDCDAVLDEFLTHKGLEIRNKAIQASRVAAEKRSGLLNILRGSSGSHRKLFEEDDFAISGLQVRAKTEGIGETRLSEVLRLADKTKQLDELIEMILASKIVAIDQAVSDDEQSRFEELSSLGRPALCKRAAKTNVLQSRGRADESQAANQAAGAAPTMLEEGLGGGEELMWTEAESAPHGPGTDIAATKAQTRGALLTGLRSGALQDAVQKMEEDEATESKAAHVGFAGPAPEHTAEHHADFERALKRHTSADAEDIRRGKEVAAAEHAEQEQEDSYSGVSNGELLRLTLESELIRPAARAAARKKQLRADLLDSVAVSRTTKLLGKVELEEYIRVAALDPCYNDGKWETGPGG